MLLQLVVYLIYKLDIYFFVCGSLGSLDTQTKHANANKRGRKWTKTYIFAFKFQVNIL